MDYKEIFDKLNPGFFDREYIKDMKEHWIFAELVMDLKKNFRLQIWCLVPKALRSGICLLLDVDGMLERHIKVYIDSFDKSSAA